MKPVTYPRRGEVYLVRIDPTLGAEIKKARPALIVQNDVANRYSPITIVAAITSKFKEPLPPVKVLITASEEGLTRCIRPRFGPYVCLGVPCARWRSLRRWVNAWPVGLPGKVPQQRM